MLPFFRASAKEYDNRASVENHSQGDDYPSSNSIPDSFSIERSFTPPILLLFVFMCNEINCKFNVHIGFGRISLSVECE